MFLGRSVVLFCSIALIFVQIVLSGRNFYNILKVKRDASKAEIKSSYRRLAKETHPDKNPDDPNASKHFQDLTDSYKVSLNF